MNTHERLLSGMVARESPIRGYTLSGLQICILFPLIMILACDNGGRFSDYNSQQKVNSQGMPDDSFFENCVFISVDIQPSKKHHMTMESMPKGWRDRGFKLEDVNAALDFLHDVAIPNAVKTADACRQLKMPMIFVHWGYQFKNGMDLDPETRKGFLQNHGTNYEKWPHYIGHQSSSPHEGFKVRPDEYVIAKTAQDAFPSSNIDYVLRNLGVKNIVFVGGHTGACLGKTSKSAKERGYRTLCIRDATWDARESTRIPNMKECNYDYIVSTAEFLKLAAKSANKEIKPAAKEPDSTVQENIKPAKRESTSKEKIARKLDGSFFENCVFVSVDHQPNKRHKFTETNMPGFYKEIGASVADLNAAVDYLFDVAKPNAVNVADACRSINLPMVFIHWGYQFHDAMDLDPETRDHFLKHFGTDFDKWPHHISRSDSKPYEGFKVRKGEYVIAKTAQNAFGSSNIDYVLRNLGAKNIVFVGGHTGGCLGRTSKSAKQRGYRTLCVKDATFDARESTRVPSMEACNYDYIVSADEFIKLVDEYSRQ